MWRRWQLPAASVPVLLVLGACADPTTVVAVDEVAANLAPGDHVVGSGHVQQAAGLREFTFHAIQHPNGSASGSYVDWIESAGDYVRIHLGRSSHLLRTTMTLLEQRLDPVRFLRIHRTAIVRLDRVHQLQPDEHGEYLVLLRSGERVRVGRSYRSAALARLGVQW